MSIHVAMILGTVGPGDEGGSDGWHDVHRGGHRCALAPEVIKKMDARYCASPVEQRNTSGQTNWRLATSAPQMHFQTRYGLGLRRNKKKLYSNCMAQGAAYTRVRNLQLVHIYNDRLRANFRADSLRLQLQQF